MVKKKRKKMWWHKGHKKRKKKKKDWKKYKKDDGLYNLIQENEIFIFLEYLPLAVLFVCKNRDLWTGQGRPPSKLLDILVCLGIKEYFGKSLRRSIGIIKLCLKAANLSYINVHSFKTLSNYLNNPKIKPLIN